MPFRRLALATLGLTILLLPLRVGSGLAAPAAVPPVEIVPHRALYTMRMGRTQPSSGIVDVRGAMVFEWADSCDGWTIEQRYRLRIVLSQGEDIELTTSYVTWEAKDGRRYRFNVVRERNGQTEEKLRGEARIEGSESRGFAEFSEPRSDRVLLPAGTLFPSEYTLRLIENAREGRKLLSRLVFDGATVDGPFEINAAIGDEHREDEPADGKAAALLQGGSWPMRLAFFGAFSQNAQPDYEVGLDLLPNGVARSLELDYGVFSIAGTLKSLERLPKPSC